MDKKQLLAQADKLNYGERIQLAAKLGRDLKDSPKLKDLIESLLAHPAPDAPQMEIEDEFVQILPPQLRNTGKYFNEDQLALTAAVASKTCLELLHREYSTNPSILFKKLLVKAIVRQEKDDEKIAEMILREVPKLRKQLIHSCVRYRRVAILEKVYPSLKKSQGVDLVADFLHGCSPDFVLAELRDEEVLYNKSLNWNGIARHHGRVIITLIRDALTTASTDINEEWDLQTVWSEWLKRIGNGGKEELLHNTSLSGEILQLSNDIPILSWIGVGERPRRADAASKDVVQVIPSLISGSLGLFICKHPEKMLQVCKQTIYIRKNRFVCGLPHNFWGSAGGWPRLRSNRYSWILEMVKEVISKSSSNTFYRGYGPQDKTILEQLFTGDFLENFSHKQMLELIKLVFEHLFSLRPDVHNFHVKGCTPQDACTKWLESVLTSYNSAYRVLRNDENILMVRERLIEDDNIDEGASTQPTSRPAPRRGQKIKAKTAATKKRIHKRSESEKAAELAKIQKLKANVAQTMSTLLKHLLATVTGQEWKVAQEGTVAQEEHSSADVKNTVLSRNRDDTSSKYLPILKSLDNHVDLIEQFYKELLSPILIKGQDLTHYTWVAVRDYLLTRLDSIVRNPKLSEQEREHAKALLAQTATLFLNAYLESPVINAEDLLSIAKHTGHDQRITLFKAYASEDLASLGTNKPSSLESLFQLVLEHRNEVSKEDLVHLYSELNKLFEEDVVSETTRDLLKPFQNVIDNKVRQVLVKAADSNSVSEREFAFRTLVTSTLLSQEPDQMKRTLTYFIKKIKNESAENRATALTILTEKLSNSVAPSQDDTAESRYTNIALSEQCLPLWNELLQHATEAQDFSSEPAIEEAFLNLSKAALARGSGNTAGPVFVFGVELQWKLALHKNGLRKCSKTFRIEFPSKLRPYNQSRHFKKGTEAQFVTGVVKAYKDRVFAKNPKFFDTKEGITTFENLYPIVRKAWINIPELVEQAKRIIALLKASPVDDEGLYIVRGDHEGIRVFEKIFAHHHAYKDRKGEEWFEIPILVEYVETILRSTQSKRVLFMWLLKETWQAKTRSEKKKARDAAIDKLLQISPSAIHIRFVWRHLVRYQQQKLDRFLGDAKSFRGVFYVEPESRFEKLPSTAEGRRANWEGGFVTDVAEHEKLQREKEEELKNEHEEFLDETHPAAQGFDHPDLFILPACYGLHRLLPRQLDQLGKQWMNRVLNEDASVVDRVKAAIRWTLLPNVTYVDVVKFFNDYEEKVGVNVIEAILKGVMQNDEPCAPLQFLLSPKFLGSDRARVAMYCIAKCVPYMPSSQMTETLEMVLTGKRRTSLKVTAYKEIIRLLCGRPTEQHMNMVLREWKRPTLHRDVRVAIVQKSVEFLSKAEFDHIAWEILSSCVTDHKDNIEILTALLGVKPEQGGRATARRTRIEGATIISAGELSGAFTKKRLLDHYAALTKSIVPERHCARYVQDIIMKLAEGAENEDIKFLATAVLPSWRQHSDSEKIQSLLLPLATHTEKQHLDNPKRDIQQVLDKRFNIIAGGIMTIAGFNTYQYSQLESKEDPLRDSAVKLVSVLVDAYKRVPSEERPSRVNLHKRLSYVLSNMQSTNAVPLNYERQIVELYSSLGTLFWKSLTERKLAQVPSNAEDFDVRARPILNDLFSFAVKYPSYEKQVYKFALRLLASCHSWNDDYTKRAFDVMRSLMSGTLGKAEDPVAQMPKYKALATYVAFKELESFPGLIAESTQQVTDFMVDVLSFAEKSPTGSSETWRSSAQTIVDTSVRTITKFYQKHADNTAHVPTPKPCVANLVQRFALLALDTSKPSAANVAYEIVRQLAQSQAVLLYLSVGDLYSYLLHAFISEYARHSRPNTELQTLVLAMLEGAQQATLSRHASYSEQQVLTKQSKELIAALVNHTLLSRDVDASVMQPMRSAAVPPAYANVVFELLMGVLSSSSKWASVIRTDKDTAHVFLHQALVRATSYADQTPTFSVYADRKMIRSALTSIIREAFESELPASEVTASAGAEFAAQEAEEAAKKEEQFQSQLAVFVERLTALLELSLVTPESNTVSAPFLLSDYRHLAYRAVLNLVKFFGMRTAIPHEVAPEPVEPLAEAESSAEAGEEKGKEKEKEKEGEKDDAKEQPKAPKKKKKAAIEYVMRPVFVDFVEKLSNDSDEVIATKARLILTTSGAEGYP
eukprot:TRINITY_DN1352_c0_g1_i3.p1 TRINITY_DN1352_c0_g1~~TRINITY_DN1352_c0_g1_i3.p1  ORF type:complete len:2194 (-),score=412.40 TRINITY_DN1352_c0_g1_i3:98-6679(-)